MSFPAASPEVQVETSVIRLRRHGRRLLLPVAVLIAVAWAGPYFIGNLPESWMNIAALVAASLIALCLGVLPILSWLSTRATITTRRVIMRRGLLVHHRSEVPLARVREVRSRRTVVQRLFGSGDIELLAGAEASFVLRDVPGPRAVVEALHELIQEGYGRDLAAAQQFGGGFGGGSFGVSGFDAGGFNASRPQQATTRFPR